MPGHRAGGDRGAAGLASPGLEVGSGLDRHLVKFEGDPDRLRDRCCSTRLGAGGGSDAVIDVMGHRFESGFSGKDEQRGRVSSS
jgi:hypothetical protein